MPAATAEHHPIVVLGLGNPGHEYEATRHNVGFMVVNQLSARLQSGWKAGDGGYVFSRIRAREFDLVLVKPLVYMNNSGECAREALERFATPLKNLLVVVDDLALPIGNVRIRAQGSHGGHNGLRSIIYHLGTGEFARVRCGIRIEPMPPKDEISSFVLSPFETGERDVAKAMVVHAADAVVKFAEEGVAATMNKFNTGRSGMH